MVVRIHPLATNVRYYGIKHLIARGHLFMVPTHDLTKKINFINVVLQFEKFYEES